MSILDILSSIISPVTDLISEIIPDPDKKLKLQTEITKIEFVARDKLLEYEKTVIDSKTKVMVAELQQKDKYTKRARPTVIYAGLVIMFLNSVLLPWITFFAGMELPTITLPGEFWYAWGGIASVYAFGRTKEKLAKK